jgi:hypothetical protein
MASKSMNRLVQQGKVPSMTHSFRDDCGFVVLGIKSKAPWFFLFRVREKLF